jgi:hypothetical protein
MIRHGLNGALLPPVHAWRRKPIRSCFPVAARSSGSGTRKLCGFRWRCVSNRAWPAAIRPQRKPRSMNSWHGCTGPTAKTSTRPDDIERLFPPPVFLRSRRRPHASGHPRAKRQGPLTHRLMTLGRFNGQEFGQEFRGLAVRQHASQARRQLHEFRGGPVRANFAENRERHRNVGKATLTKRPARVFHSDGPKYGPNFPHRVVLNRPQPFTGGTDASSCFTTNS